ncbi:uncharacterized protein METZ01_LOCUS423993 [marine metagenome]|uniref:Uncharacterized protein n=1 Tax=marine metagenome TaxID=408172 RepID=A0A382XJY6_9ZZZZ
MRSDFFKVEDFGSFLHLTTWYA